MRAALWTHSCPVALLGMVQHYCYRGCPPLWSSCIHTPYYKIRLIARIIIEIRSFIVPADVFGDLVCFVHICLNNVMLCL